MDIVQNIVKFIGEGVTWLQLIGFALDAGAWGMGFFILLSSGAEGKQKARPWFIGASIGLVGLALAPQIPDFIRGKIGF